MIEGLYAYVYWDEEKGREFILGCEQGKSFVPCISPEVQALQSLGREALPAAIRAGKKVNLVKFSSREVLFSRDPTPLHTPSSYEPPSG